MLFVTLCYVMGKNKMKTAATAADSDCCKIKTTIGLKWGLQTGDGGKMQSEIKTFKTCDSRLIFKEGPHCLFSTYR